MITKEQTISGTKVMIGDRPTTIISGSYEDENSGWMIKTSLYPGGYPADRHYQSVPIDTPTEPQTADVLPAVSFELTLIDEVEPVKITAELIRQKTKPLTDLSIVNMFDEKGYAEVKKAVTKAVKLRTAIEKQEKEHLGKLKATYDTKKKEVTDYTAELYVACREAQTALEAKLTVIDNAKKEAADKLAADEKSRTEGRDNSLFNIGMTFNGQAFVGYGKVITKNSLHSLGQEAFDSLVTELEVLQLEQGVTGEIKPTPEHNVGGAGSAFTVRPAISFEGDDEPAKLFENEVYSVAVGGYTWVLTKGQVTTIEHQIIANQQVMQSAIYAQVISTGFTK